MLTLKELRATRTPELDLPARLGVDPDSVAKTGYVYAGHTYIEDNPDGPRGKGLTDAKKGWVTVSEYNYDIIEQSWDFPINSPPQGRFSRPFLKKVQAAALITIRSEKGRVDRTG